MRSRPNKASEPDTAAPQTIPAESAAAPVATRVVESATTVAAAASTQLNAAVSPITATDTPSEPAAAPVAWSLLAFARRDLESNQPAKVVLPAAGDTQSLYTGQPSFVADVVVIGLRVINVVTKALGLPSFFTLSSASLPIISDGVPPSFITGGLGVTSSQFEGWQVWTLTPGAPSGKHVVAIHGGGYVGQVNILQWATYADLARDTGATVVVPLYPLAPQGTAASVVPVAADFISAQITAHGAENVSVLGDSAGGQIALSAAQLLVRRHAAVPARIVLLSPVLDNTLSNPTIPTIDDPLLDAKAGYQNGLLWAKGLDLRDPLVSPLYGSLDGLPPITVYSGSLDLLSPDVLVLRNKALAGGHDVTFELRRGQIHDWVVLPFLPDAIAERPGIYRHLGLLSNEARRLIAP